MIDLRIVVAGHVDHGKSTLIGRLLYETGSLPQQVADRFDRTSGPGATPALAFITDQLSEEQQGSFTLDTTQAHLRIAGRDCTLIDTPGHREFLRNMVTGTTRADAAMLVVDAAEGPRPQTYLHAYLIAMLGIRRVIVAINKMDQVSYDSDRFHDLSRQLSAHLERIGIPPMLVIPVSAQQGDHIARRSDRMEWSSTPVLVEALTRLAPPEKDGDSPLRFLVQCPFSRNGRRTILGKVLSGTLRRGQPLIFGPHGHRTVVTSITAGPQEADAATAGQCVGILLQDASPVERGHVGFDGDVPPTITDRLQARVFWVGSQPLAVNDGIEILCGTQSRHGYVEEVTEVMDPVSLEVVNARATHLDDSQVAGISIRTDAPVCIDPFDLTPELGRFALLQSHRTVGGGVVIKREAP